MEGSCVDFRGIGAKLNPVPTVTSVFIMTMNETKMTFLQRSALEMILVAGALMTAAPTQAQNGVPRPDHVVIVIEENKSFGHIIGSAGAPYINSLAQRGALFTSSFAIRHPSEPNYLALFSGSTHGIGDDSCPHTFVTANLASELFDAGFTFSGYSESMPRAGYKGCDAGNYARKHNPWVNFTNVPASANLTFASFPTNFSELPTVSIIVPNLNNDMHDGPIPQGDAWLQDHIEGYLQWAASHNSLFLLTWDEGHNGSDNRIVTLMVGPMVRPGEYCEHINHYNTLRTLLEMYGLAPIGKDASVDPITSAWTPESASSPVSIALASPVLAGPAAVTLNVEAASANGEITLVEFFQRSTKLGEATNRPFTFTWTNVSAGSYCFVAKATDAQGHRRTSLSVPLEVHVSDGTLPTVSITSPPSDIRVTNNFVILEGAASDNVEVARVQYQVGDGPVQVAEGTTNWSARIELAPGPAVIRVQSVDTSSNQSSVVTRTVTYAVLSRLTTQITGNGKIVPDFNGQDLEVGRSYQFKAMPDPGYVFAEAGVGAASAGPVSFTMESNLILSVHFVLNPFPAVMGNYQGLIYDTNQVAPESSGFFALTLDAKGGFTGRIQLGGRSVRVSSGFDAFGHASTPLSRTTPTTNLSLTADWELDLTNGTDQIHGAVRPSSSSSSFGGASPQELFAEILGDRDVFKGTTNHAAQAGQYTVIFPNDDHGAPGPDGDSVGAVTVSDQGQLRLSGTLADGTKLTQSATLSKAGMWPLYVPLSAGHGTFLGWIGFTNQITNDLGGLVTWITPSRPGAKFYPDGFTNESQTVGSVYHAPGPTERILNVTNIDAIFEGAELSATLTNRVRLEPNGTVSNQSSNRLSLTFTKSTGLWKGTVLDPATGRSLLFRGVVLQGQNDGSGFFLSTNRSGHVQLQSE